MKQLLQNLGSGATILEDVPCPSIGSDEVLIATHASVVSIGTEKMLVEFGKASLLQKVRKQPDKVRQVLDKVKTDGLAPTLHAVRSKLDQPIPLGYCNAGVVLEVGRNVRDLRPGDRVVSNGCHAEVVAVPESLCTRVPDGVSFEDAAFTVVGAIALQGIRLISPTLGETVVVTGLGLIGLIAVQLLVANGCTVIGIDFDDRKCDLAEMFGAKVVRLGQGQDPVTTAIALNEGAEVDAVLITASTSSNEPVHQAATMCRKRGRIVLTGVVGLELTRDDFYKKELSFQVSCSYGPGRYEAEYEQKGRDYPIAFVRWTAKRNFDAILGLLASGRLAFSSMITHRHAFGDAVEVYNNLGGGALGVVLQYPRPDSSDLRTKSVDVALPTGAREPRPGAKIGVLGAGGFTANAILPSLQGTAGKVEVIVSKSGLTAATLARKFSIPRNSTDTAGLFRDSGVDLIFITTRHDTHAKFVCEGLLAGKAVFVEKPLAITRAQLDEVIAAYGSASRPFVMVGFNRRFAPHVQTLRTAMAREAGPKAIVMTINAGFMPADHWTQDPEIGGGRMLGEGCHFIDLARFLVGAPISEVRAVPGRDAAGNPIEDQANVMLSFADGSTATIAYLANGSKTFPKERVEVFVNGKIAQIDNFRTFRAFGWPGLKPSKLRTQAKGHAEEVAAVVKAVQDGDPAPIPFVEIVEVMRATFDAADQLRV